MAYLSIDVGTTMVKAVMFDAAGHEIKVARHGTVVNRGPNGESEQDMYSVWDAVVHAVRTVVHLVQEPVEAIALTGQGDGVWLLGPDGRPTGPAILWNDARASAITAAWATSGLLDEAYRINGNLGFPGTQTAILTWLRANDPERLEASHKSVYCTGWIYNRMTGEFAADESDAASPFLNITTGEYSPEILEMFDMPWAERLLPEVRRDGSRISALTDTAAAELRVPTGLPVVLAPFDIPVTAIGIGAVRPGQACTILGTTLSTDIVLDRFVKTSRPAGMTLPSGVPGTYIKSLAAMAGVEIVSWGQSLMGLDNPNWLSDLAATTDPGANGLLFHPYMSPAGERAPFLDPQARGSLIGLSFEHSRAHIARALIEGMSYAIRNCLEYGDREITDFRLSGGGANSAVWCQILADVSGIPTMRSKDSEIGAKGALLTGLVALGIERDMVAAADRYVEARHTYEPNPVAVRVYEEMYGRFIALLPEMAKQWPAVAETREAIAAVNARATTADEGAGV